MREEVDLLGPTEFAMLISEEFDIEMDVAIEIAALYVEQLEVHTQVMK